MLICLRFIQESELKTIDLSEDGSLVSHLVNFLYTGNYPTSADTDYVEDPSSAGDAKNTSRELDTLTYAESLEYYLAKPLTELDHHHPKAAASSEPSAPDYSVHVEMYALADKYDIPALGILATAKFDHTCTLNWHPTLFLETIPRVYDSTLESNQGLRTVVLDHVRKHSGAFMADEHVKEKVHALFTAIPEFGWGLYSSTYMAKEPAVPDDKPRHAICRTCGFNVPKKVDYPREVWQCGE